MAVSRETARECKRRSARAACSTRPRPPRRPRTRRRGSSPGGRRILDEAGLAAQDVSHVLHGTTVATNAILEGRGAECALLTTTGFRHVIEIGRHDIPRTGNIYAWVKPERPVPPERIYEIDGRIGPRGARIAAAGRGGGAARGGRDPQAGHPGDRGLLSAFLCRSGA
ncbi:hydantoinase/oxoprolinase N-terminal domain-containing protein [Acidimangrovimonas sediminis]|uniref:hydantoinase/oxoprolinase N-terminal domain-containing protein n=1 Tax=Acidimangrovimonas sediminis TaxID=2056283 RepID=UPI000C80A79B